MNNCLEQAMFAASESYSHTTYDLGGGGCSENIADEETQMLTTKEPVAFTQAA